jgi:hypothetical protein
VPVWRPSVATVDLLMKKSAIFPCISELKTPAIRNEMPLIRDGLLGSSTAHGDDGAIKLDLSGIGLHIDNNHSVRNR